MNIKDTISSYAELKEEGVKLLNELKLLISSGAEFNKIKDIENEIIMIQNEKSHYAMRFIEEFIL